MLGFVVRMGFRMLALAGVLYVTFFVPIGPRTLYSHVTRIAATSEARDLGTAVYASAKDALNAGLAKLDTLRPHLGR
jgi:hypothetical protein